MSYCPYSDEELELWDGVSKPMGEACNDCENTECEHNPNPGPDDFEFDDGPRGGDDEVWLERDVED